LGFASFDDKHVIAYDFAAVSVRDLYCDVDTLPEALTALGLRLKGA